MASGTSRCRRARGDGRPRCTSRTRPGPSCPAGGSRSPPRTTSRATRPSTFGDARAAPCSYGSHGWTRAPTPWRSARFGSRPDQRRYAPSIGTGRAFSSWDDARLVDAAGEGDRDALDALLRRHYDRLHAVCRRLAGNEADAADACQEALVAIVRGLPRFDRRAAFSTWAYRVTTNACLDELRRRGRRPTPGIVPEEMPGGGPALDRAVAAR